MLHNVGKMGFGVSRHGSVRQVIFNTQLCHKEGVLVYSVDMFKDYLSFILDCYYSGLISIYLLLANIVSLYIRQNTAESKL